MFALLTTLVSLMSRVYARVRHVSVRDQPTVHQASIRASATKNIYKIAEIDSGRDHDRKTISFFFHSKGILRDSGIIIILVVWNIKAYSFCGRIKKKSSLYLFIISC